MNAYAIFYVNEHLQSLRDDAALNRKYQVERPSIRDQVASVVASLRRTFAIQGDATNAVLPKLENHPYRG